MHRLAQQRDNDQIALYTPYNARSWREEEVLKEKWPLDQNDFQPGIVGGNTRYKILYNDELNLIYIIKLSHHYRVVMSILSLKKQCPDDDYYVEKEDYLGKRPCNMLEEVNRKKYIYNFFLL